MARPPMGEKLLEAVPGSKVAKDRVSLMLETMSGKKTVLEACQELGIGEARFHELRRELLESLVALAEPKPLGRPRQEIPQESEYVTKLESENRELKRQLNIELVRLHLAAAVPEVLLQNQKKRPSGRPKSED
jgi:hypothetical protein